MPLLLISDLTQHDSNNTDYFSYWANVSAVESYFLSCACDVTGEGCVMTVEGYACVAIDGRVEEKSSYDSSISKVYLAGGGLSMVIDAEVEDISGLESSIS